MKLPHNKSLYGLARNLRNNGTKTEAILWRYLKKKNGYGYQFHRQKNIGQYIVDFYCSELALVIEVDGNSHDNKYEYDKKRDEYLKDLGLLVLHIESSDVIFCIDKVLYAIESYMEHQINNLKK